MVRTLATLLILLLFGAVGASAQGVRASENFTLAPYDSTIVLSHEFILPGTLLLMVDSIGVVSASQYSVDERFGVIRFVRSIGAIAGDSVRVRHVSVGYSYRPILLPREFYRRKLVTLTDSSGTVRQVAQGGSDLTAASIFGKNFQRSGVLSRGFTVGTNRDLTLQSSLRLQFSGNVTDNVEVLGALTDEQTPIQPEGNTQTLQEIDNVFIEIRSPTVGATLGKFIATSTGSSYTAFSRKLQGGKGGLTYGKYGSLEVVAAVAPGKFKSQLIQGRERDQGPYQLTGENDARDIVVVAGTEHVFVDGVQMTRGENNDYVIDYSTAQIFFQTRRPITSISRITVDFEYNDRQYSRSFLAAANSNYLFDSALTITTSFVREADNPDSPIDITLSDADRALLKSAGGDRLMAARSGASIANPGDSLRGIYLKVDTLIDGRPDSIYRYALGDPAAVYNVTFSVGPDQRGDYRNVAFGQYEFVGRGLGTYLPVIYLPFPELRQVVAVALRTRPIGGVTIAGEAAISDASLNRFSVDPSAQLNGAAFTAAMFGGRDTFRLGGANLGAIRFGATAQYVGARFQTVERLGDVDFSNRWNVSARPGESRASNFILEDTINYLPLPRLSFLASNGYLSQGGDFFSIRQQYTGRFLGDSALPGADYTFELITTDTLQAARKGKWYRQRGGISQILGAITPGFRFEAENREDRAGSSLTDTLYPSSFKFLEIGPDVRIDLPFMTTTASARYRIDDSVRYDSTSGVNRFLRDGIARTFTLHGALRGIRDLTSTIDFTYRLKTYDSIGPADVSDRLDRSTILARSQTRWVGLDRGLEMEGLYDVQTEQAARLQRLFLLVPHGQGEYVWTDLDSNGRQSTEEFRLALPGEGDYVRYDFPTEQLYPVIDLTTSARIRLQPDRILKGDGGIGKILAPVTAETTLRLEEKSQDERESDIYLLRLSHFQDDSTTLLGNATFQQDLNLFESNPEYSFRLRYYDRRGLTRLVSTLERNRTTERTLRTRWQPTYDIGLQLDLGSNNDLLTSSDTSSSRTFNLSLLTAANDFSYRPEQSLELGWILKVRSSRDILPIVPRTTFLNTNEIRAIYSIETRGQIRLSIERTGVSGTNVGEDPLALPYQLTDGYAIGTTWIGRASVEYRFGSNIQASLSYTGRAQPPTNRVLNIGQAEVRAFF